MKGRDDERDAELPDWAHAIEAMTAPVTPPSALRARLLARLEGPDRYRPFGALLRQVFDLEGVALDELLERASTPSAWTPGITPVRRYLDFSPGSSASALAPRAGLVTLAAGARIPAHRHEEPEVMLVLEGRVTDNHGHDARPGDRIVSEVGSSHTVDIPDAGDAVVALLHGKIHLLGI